MPFHAGSLEDVEAWAKHEFPAYFVEVARIAHPPINKLILDGEYIDGKVIMRSILVLAIEIGQTNTGQTVYARISENDNVELFSIHQVVFPTHHERFVFMKPVVGLADIILRRPFKYPIQTGHQAGVDRLETLIRYMYLRGGEDTAVQLKLGFFKTHFRGACHDIARSEDFIVRDDELDDSETLAGMTATSTTLRNDISDHYGLGDSPPDLITDTDTTKLRDNPAATSIFNNHVHVMDEGYHDFKTRMLAQLNAMQTNDRNQMAQLQAQIYDVERKLAVSEEDRMKLEKELQVERAKTKYVSEETANCKAKFEDLKATLERVVNQRF